MPNQLDTAGLTADLTAIFGDLSGQTAADAAAALAAAIDANLEDEPGGGGGGVTDHLDLVFDTWANDGHLGGAGTLAGFDLSGEAEEVAVGTGLVNGGGTLSVDFGTGSGEVCEGDDTRLQRAAAVVVADAAPSLGTAYERTATGLIALLADRTWGADIADALASPPTDWTWDNSGLVNTAAVASSQLDVDYDTGSTYDWSGATNTAPRVRKGRSYRVPTSGGSLVFRLKASALALSTKYLLVQLDDLSGATRYVHLGLRGGNPGNVYWKFGPAGGVAGVSVTTAEMAAGVWFRIQFVGIGLTLAYSLDTGSTPPTTWTPCNSTTTGTSATYWQHAFATFDLSLVALLPTSGGTMSGSLCYLDDSTLAADTFVSPNPDDCARGYDASSPVLTLVASADLGSAAAVIADASVQAALGAVENPRPQDSATWTYSVVRGASASPAAGSYAAAGSVTVSGTGRYLAVYAKCTSDGTEPGSLRAPDLRIPVTW